MSLLIFFLMEFISGIIFIKLSYNKYNTYIIISIINLIWVSIYHLSFIEGIYSINNNFFYTLFEFIRLIGFYIYSFLAIFYYEAYIDLFTKSKKEKNETIFRKLTFLIFLSILLIFYPISLKFRHIYYKKIILYTIYVTLIYNLSIIIIENIKLLINIITLKTINIKGLKTLVFLHIFYFMLFIYFEVKYFINEKNANIINYFLGIFYLYNINEIIFFNYIKYSKEKNNNSEGINELLINNCYESDCSVIVGYKKYFRKICKLKSIEILIKFINEKYINNVEDNNNYNNNISYKNYREANEYNLNNFLVKNLKDFNDFKEIILNRELNLKENKEILYEFMPEIFNNIRNYENFKENYKNFEIKIINDTELIMLLKSIREYYHNYYIEKNNNYLQKIFGIFTVKFNFYKINLIIIEKNDNENNQIIPSLNNNDNINDKKEIKDIILFLMSTNKINYEFKNNKIWNWFNFNKRWIKNKNKNIFNIDSKIYGDKIYKSTYNNII